MERGWFPFQMFQMRISIEEWSHCICSGLHDQIHILILRLQEPVVVFLASLDSPHS